MKAKIHTNSILMKFFPKKYNGFTLGNHIFIREKTYSKKLLLHETKHVTQYNQYGFFKFCYLYLRETIRSGYYNNKYEIEARQYAIDELEKINK